MLSLAMEEYTKAIMLNKADAKVTSLVKLRTSSTTEWPTIIASRHRCVWSTARNLVMQCFAEGCCNAVCDSV